MCRPAGLVGASLEALAPNPTGAQTGGLYAGRSHAWTMA